MTRAGPWRSVAVLGGAWALLSKTISRQGHFGWHLRVFVIAALALLALNAVPGLIAFTRMSSFPALGAIDFVRSATPPLLAA